MGRSESSAPRWSFVDPEVVEVLVRVREGGGRQFGALEQSRAKTILRREVAIELEGDAGSNLVQRDAPVQSCAPVQQLSETERDVLEVLDEYGPIVPVYRIAEILECDPEPLRDGEVHALQVRGLVEGVPSRGIRRKK